MTHLSLSDCSLLMEIKKCHLWNSLSTMEPFRCIRYEIMKHVAEYTHPKGKDCHNLPFPNTRVITLGLPIINFLPCEYCSIASTNKQTSYVIDSNSKPDMWSHLLTTICEYCCILTSYTLHTLTIITTPFNLTCMSTLQFDLFNIRIMIWRRYQSIGFIWPPPPSGHVWTHFLGL